MGKFALLLVFLFSGFASKVKLESLVSLSSQSNNVIKLNSETFKEFVIDQSKNYIIVVLFSTIVYQQQCPACIQAGNIFDRIAYSYKSTVFDENDSNGKRLKPIFFARFDYTQETQELYFKMGFKNIPNILVSSKSIQSNGNSYSIPYDRLLEIRPGNEITDEKILKFVNEKTERKVELKFSFTEIVFPYVAGASAIIGLLYLVFLIKTNVFNAKLWWVFGMVVYIVCMGGAVYDLIHGAQLLGFDEKTGENEYVLSGARSQYILEGFFMSFLISLSGIAFLCINFSAYLKKMWLQRMTGIFFIGLFMCSIFYVTEIYKSKVTWYTPSFTPPAHYKQGPLIVDQGNSF